MRRRLTRFFALCAVLLAVSVAAPLPAAGSNILHDAFSERPIEERRALQARLARHALYTGIIDGAWSPGTGRALLRAADQIRWHLPDQRRLDLSHPSTVRAWLGALLEGAFDDALPQPPSSPGSMFEFLNAH